MKWLITLCFLLGLVCFFPLFSEACCVLAWDPPQVNNEDVAGYKVYFQADGKTTAVELRPDAKSSMKVISLPSVCEKGMYWVKTINKYGVLSNRSMILTVTK